MTFQLPSLTGPAWRSTLEHHWMKIGAASLRLLRSAIGHAPTTAEALAEGPAATVLVAAEDMGIPPEEVDVQDFLSKSDSGVIVEMGWTTAWASVGFPKVTLGHKLAAAMMASTVDGSAMRFIEAPWPAYYIELPDKLLFSDSGEIAGISVARYDWDGPSGKRQAWAWVAVDQKGYMMHAFGLDDRYLQDHEGVPQDPKSAGLSAREQRLWGVIGRLILGVNLRFNTKSGITSRESKIDVGSGRGSGRGGLPPTRYTYRLTGDVDVDARQFVRDYVEGRAKLEREDKGKAQSFVRGHYKMQPHGPRSSLRRLAWIEPYFRGDPDAEIAVRAHVMAEE